jgi:hypothetical protein
MVTRIACCLLLTAACSLSMPAHAQDHETRAKELFFKGHEAADRGDHASACESFRESLKYFRRVSTLLNLGKCSDAIGQIAEALRYWTEAAALLEPTDARMTLAKKRIDDLEERVPQLTLQLPAQLPDGSVVELDGVVLPPQRYRAALRLNPGVRYEVSLLTPGHAPTRESVELAPSERRQLTLAPGLAVKKEPRAPAPTQPSGLSGIQVGGIAIGAVGLAGLVAGGITGGLVLDRKATVETHCANDVCTDPEGIDAADSGRTLATVSTVAFIAGGALLGTGILMLILGDGTTEPATATFTLAPGRAGLTLVGHW